MANIIYKAYAGLRISHWSSKIPQYNSGIFSRNTNLREKKVFLIFYFSDSYSSFTQASQLSEVIKSS